MKPKSLKMYYAVITNINTINKHYVYELVDPFTNNPFYIGKGSGYRYTRHFHECYTGATANPVKCQTINSIINRGMKVLINIPFTYDTEIEALNKERELIKTYGRLTDNSGLLTNITEGGVALSGTNNPMYGKKRTDSEKQRISMTRKANLASGRITPTRHTEEWRQHLREDNAGGKATAKPILQICVETGSVLKEWSSSRQAGIGVGLESSWRNISRTANNKTHFTCAGYLWRWAGDSEVINGKLSTIETIKQELKKERAAKPVLQIDKITNEILREWPSASSVYQILGIHYGSISRVCSKKEGSAGGFIWRFTADCEFTHSSTSFDSSAHVSPEQP